MNLETNRDASLAERRAEVDEYLHKGIVKAIVGATVLPPALLQSDGEQNKHTACALMNHNGLGYKRSWAYAGNRRKGE